MSSYWLLNNVRLGTNTRRAGSVVNDAYDDLASLRAAGAQLWPFGDAGVGAAAALAKKIMMGGGDPSEASEIMLAAACGSVQSQQTTAANVTTSDGVEVTPASPSTQVFRQLWNGDVVVRVSVTVTSPFDGAPTISIGAVATPLLAAADVALGTAASYEWSGLWRATSTDMVVVSFVPGGSTVGAAQVYVETKVY